MIDSSIIWKSFQGELTVEEEQFLFDWLEEDQSHRSYYENAKKFFEKGSSFDDKGFNRMDAWNKINDHIDPPASKGRYVFRLLAVAASLLIAISAHVYLVNREELQPQPQPQPQPQKIAEIIVPGNSKATLLINGIKTHSFTEDLDTSYTTTQSVLKTSGATLEYVSKEENVETIATNTLVIPRGGNFSVILSDGTKVWLNADSKLSYPEVFTGEDRRVTITGEAYFEVAHNTKQPFIVESKSHTIEVLGTSFNINAYPEDEFITTTLVEGAVKIGKESALEPGQQSKYFKETGEIEIANVDVYQFVSWKSDIFYFENRRLDDILQILARWYDFEYVIEDRDQEGLMFSGGFKKYDSFDSIIKKIELTNEVKFEITNGKVIVQ